MCRLGARVDDEDDFEVDRSKKPEKRRLAEPVSPDSESEEEMTTPTKKEKKEIGRASCRERV